MNKGIIVPGIIVPGTIIAATVDDWFDIPGAASHKGLYKLYRCGRNHTWKDHFVKRRHFYRVTSLPNNNGRFDCVDFRGKRHCFFYAHEVEIVKGAM